MTDESGADDLQEHKGSDPDAERRRQVSIASGATRSEGAGSTSITGLGHLPRLVNSLARQELAYSLAGLVVGLLCVLGGIVLFLLGITGNVSWTTKVLEAESRLADASPGAVLFVVGLFVVFITRYRFKAKK